MSDPTAPKPSPKSPIGDSPLKYQQAYLWLVLVSAMDIMLTWIVLYVGGKEVNPIAEYVIRSTGLAGMLAFKFCLVVLVVILCEEVGRRNDRKGQQLCMVAIGISAVPVLLALMQLALNLRGIVASKGA